MLSARGWGGYGLLPLCSLVYLFSSAPCFLVPKKLNFPILLEYSIRGSAGVFLSVVFDVVVVRVMFVYFSGFQAKLLSIFMLLLLF